MKHDVFNKELGTIDNTTVREFATDLLDNAQDYFYEIGASTTGKYHPSYALGNGGLVRHTKALIGIMNSLLQLEQYQQIFTPKERDLLRVAGIVHDIEKCGRNGSKYTVHEHPLLASSYVSDRYDKYMLTDVFNVIANSDIEFIKSSINTHMGEWNTNKKSKIVLPKPETEAQKFLHLCDYLASRKFLEYVFDEEVANNTQPNQPSNIMVVSMDEYRMTFGRHQGVLLRHVAYEDFGYIEWLNKQEWIDGTLRQYTKELIEDYATKN